MSSSDAKPSSSSDNGDTNVGRKRKAAAAPLANADDAKPAKDCTDGVRSRLECVCCFNLMLPPIRQCAEGHNFCDKCSSRLMTGSVPSSRKCPTCRIPLSNPVARARNLEQWASEVDVEVVCDLEGCGETFKYSQSAEHQRTCLGRTVPCPKRGCCWRGEPSALGAHLQSEEGGHQLCPVSIPAKFSARHADYSTTVIFETKRKVGDHRRWRPPRQLIVVPPNASLSMHTSVTFVVALWKASGAGEPFVAAIQALRKPGHDEIPFSFDLSLSAYPRPPGTLCVSRASAVGPVCELNATEVWKRPRLAKVATPVLVADKASMGIFNTAQLDVNDTSSVQRYELHVRLLPLVQPGIDPSGPPAVEGVAEHEGGEFSHYERLAGRRGGSSADDVHLMAGDDSGDEDYSSESIDDEDVEGSSEDGDESDESDDSDSESDESSESESSESSGSSESSDESSEGGRRGRHRSRDVALVEVDPSDIDPSDIDPSDIDPSDIDPSDSDSSDNEQHGSRSPRAVSGSGGESSSSDESSDSDDSCEDGSDDSADGSSSSGSVSWED